MIEATICQTRNYRDTHRPVVLNRDRSVWSFHITVQRQLSWTSIIRRIWSHAAFNMFSMNDLCHIMLLTIPVLDQWSWLLISNCGLPLTVTLITRSAKYRWWLIHHRWVSNHSKQWCVPVGLQWTSWIVLHTSQHSRWDPISYKRCVLICRNRICPILLITSTVVTGIHHGRAVNMVASCNSLCISSQLLFKLDKVNNIEPGNTLCWSTNKSITQPRQPDNH